MRLVKRMFLLVTLSLASAGFLIMGCSKDDGEATDVANTSTPGVPTPSVNIAGIWDAYWVDEIGTTEYFSFTQSGNTLGGFWCDNEDGPMELTGTISGNMIDVMVHYPAPIFWHVNAEVDNDVAEFTGTVTVRNAGPYNGVHEFRCIRRIQ